ncbi:hypothetical protein [Rhizobium sp. BK251]|uniref:hypothetical protein n=1 Tax=Rhizobium sp. BK251 TaxID=2512125 RepID=UPI001043433E|nr:hypothetical protein [Rhizobium sp. BK251]TCL71880.1 hypothetical protein EV286_105137 [Rhizobium sp. BK251]
MKYLSELYRAVGGRLVAIPGALSFLFAATAFLRGRVPFLSWLPAVPSVDTVPLWVLLLLSLVPLCSWALVGLTVNAVRLRERLEALDAAWDRSGRDLVPLRDAMEAIIESLSDQWGQQLSTAQRQRKAAAKIRQIGHENQIPIWGLQLLDDDNKQAFQEHLVQIPPQAWKRIMVDVEAVFGRVSTPEAPVLQTVEDPAFALSVDVPELYGDLRVKAASIKAAFPKL